MDPAQDRSGHRFSSTGALTPAGKQWLKHLGIVDMWCAVHPHSTHYTFYSHVHHTYARLDHFLGSTDLYALVNDIDITPAALSDHDAVSVTIAVLKNPPNSRRWRLRESLLHRQGVVSQLTTCIKQYLTLNDQPDTSLASLWGALKAVIRGELISISAAETKERKEKRATLTAQVTELERVHSRTGAPRIWRQLKAARAQLASLDLDRAEFAALKLKHTYYVGGDKTGRLLASKLRARTQHFKIPEVYNSRHKLVSQDTQIADAFREFYASLYTADPATDAQGDEYLAQTAITALNPSEAESLEAPIRTEEIIAAISRLKPLKLPGPDVYTASFYKLFCPLLAPVLTHLFNSFQGPGSIPSDMLAADIVVIPKSGKDPKLCAAYRPISLLNLDLKLFTGVLAARLGPKLPGIVDPDQSGFIPNRQCSDNTKRTMHLIDKAQVQQLDAALLSVDAEKAFDGVDWDFLGRTLERFGLGRRFRAWVASCHATPRAHVRLNGITPKPFNIQRGTRHGCPLSPLLFALYIEPLAQRIRDNPDIQGIRFGKERHTISLYADDLLATLEQPACSVPALIDEHERFGRVTGLKINTGKSMILPLGSNGRDPHVTLQSLGDFQLQDAIPYLGISLISTTEQTRVWNYTKLLAQVQQDLGEWQNYTLSLLGRIAATKMVALPRILYVFQTLPVSPPPGVLKKLQDLLQHYIWAGKRQRMRRDLVYRHPNEGGLGVPNLLKYYQATQLRYLVEWCRPESKKRWLFQDGALTSTDIGRIPFLKRKDRSRFLHKSPVTGTVMRVWDSTVTKYNLTSFPSPLTPLLDNPDFTPGTDRLAYRDLRQSECQSAGHLFDLDGFLPFATLKDWYNLPNMHLFQYFQIQHWLMHPDIRPMVDRKMTPFEKWLITKDTDRRLISDIYRMLSLPPTHHRSPGQLRWERELGRALSNKEWQDIYFRANHTARNTASREAAVKVATYWYLTMPRLNKGNPDRSPNCWRGCDEIGTLTHLLWDCPEVRDYWSTVLDDMNKCFDTAIPRFPDYTLLGLPNALTFPLKSKRGRQMGLAMGAAVQHILSLWGSHTRPTKLGWLHKIWFILGMEKLQATLTQSKTSFSEIWNPLLSLLSQEFHEVTCPRYLRLLRITDPNTSGGTSIH